MKEPIPILVDSLEHTVSIKLGKGGDIISKRTSKRVGFIQLVLLFVPLFLWQLVVRGPHLLL